MCEYSFLHDLFVMNHGTDEPPADNDSSETLLEGTDHVMLEPSGVPPGADDSYGSASGDKNVTLHNKDTVESVDIVGVADLGSKQSTGSDSLLDASNVRGESSCDAVITESLSSKCDEIEGMEVETNGTTDKSHSDVKKVVTNRNVISEKVTHKEYEELNVKEKVEDEVCEKENKAMEEVGNKKEREIEEVNDKQNNKIDSVTDDKAKEIDIEEKETELCNKEKKIHVDGNEPEANSEGKDKHGLTAELLDSEDKETEGKEPEGETRMSTEKELVSRALSEERETDVDDPDRYPEHINFVDVNAPTCYSPMVIDDDDDDDEVVMIERRKGTGHCRKPGNMQKHTTGNCNCNSSPEVVVQGEFCRRRQEVVIDLGADDHDDDDIEIETIKKKKKKRPDAQKGVFCCNVECSSLGHDLRIAPVFVLTHYGRKYKKGKAEKVCGACFEAAMKHQEHLSYLLSEHIPLMTAKFHSRYDTVVLTDSEEGSEGEEPLPDDVLSDLQEKLEEVLESTMEKYDLNYQIEESKKILTEKLDGLSSAFKETDDLFRELQRKMDCLQNDLYKDYQPEIRELPSLTIDDNQCGIREPVIQFEGINSQPSHRQQKTDTMQRNPLAPLTPSASQKQRVAISQPSYTGNIQADGIRRSPIAGVATKKVTQVQRSVIPVGSRPEVRQEDVVALEQVEVSHKPLPPVGALVRPKPSVGDVMYVMKQSLYGVWSRARVLEVTPKGSELASGVLTLYNQYKVKFESTYRKSNYLKQVTGRQMAYASPSPVRLPVGTRVIAIFKDNDWSKESYYSGVISEPPKSMNKYRYLVFFDDGYAQYVTHEKILLVCESSRNVWDDIHPDSKDFIRKYLEQYPERPMVKLQQGQIVKTEWNGKWWIARVVEVDGSLVKMHFDADGRTEWIYRGSTRLGPLYAELAYAASRKEQGTFSRHRGLGVATLKKRNMPYVEYTRGTDGEEMRRDDSGGVLLGQSSESVPSRAVAKKSTTKRPDGVMDRMQEEQQTYQGHVEKIQQPPGRIEYLQLNTSYKRPEKFKPHQCGPRCLAETQDNRNRLKGQNPLIIPLLCRWERQVNRCRGKRVVMYRAPCGRRLRNMDELHRYLRLTRSNKAVDLFDFDFWVHCFDEFVAEKGFTDIRDLSYGKEHVPVPCINNVDNELPSYVTYSTKREATTGVDLNLEPEFLIGCDCTDDCQDREKCACWQLTIQGTAYGPGGVVDPTVGYYYRRLPEPVMTGIYECNSKCKCAKNENNTCLNRVAQQPLQLKLQVFKTADRGWGIRCLNDIPQGGFICIYAGRLLTEQGANEGGKNYGDEYLAELDYIEVVEKLKEGYESDIVDDSDSSFEEKGSSEARRTKDASEEEEEEEEEGEASQDARDSDEEFQLAPWEKGKGNPLPEQSSIRTRLRNRNSRHGSDDSQNDPKDKGTDADSKKKSSRRQSSSDHNYSDDEDSGLLRQPSRFSVVSEPKESDKSKRPKHRSVREFFGPDEYCYIMDAKNNGNIGRYLNHSCSPNVFVQNVFVDTHDLRFPWVAFFALTYIRAGTELTWDYNYDVGSVPGKVLHCYCGSNDCRGRLL